MKTEYMDQLLSNKRINEQQNRQTDTHTHMYICIYNYSFMKNTVHDNRVLSKLIVANGLRRIIDKFSFVCVRGDSLIS